jgi:hypothetical protein
MEVGINLGPVNDWNREWVFLDIAKQAREWRLIERGQVKKEVIRNFKFFDFEPGIGVQTMVLVNQEGRYPKGIYNVFFKGEGRVIFKGQGVSVVDSRDHKDGTYLRLDIQGDKGVIIQVFDAPISDLSIVWPGLRKFYNKTPFHPLFTWDLKRFKFIRFLNWMHTNGVYVTRKWEERTRWDDRQSYTWDGVAVEYMVELCNETKTDPWFCMPHLYDEDYMRNFARYVKNQLHKDAKIYVEFSNETWNAMFTQHAWAKAKAQSENLKWPEVVADEAKRMWDIWDSIFRGSSDRIVKVIGGNAASPWPIQVMLRRWEDFEPDMVALGSYFAPTPDQIREMDPEITAEDLLEMSANNISIRQQFIRNHIKVCEGTNVVVGVYEGGQGIIGRLGWLDSAYDAQILPEMYDATYDVLQAAEDVGCPVFGIFQYAGDRTDQYGSWGHFEFQDQALLSDDELKIEAPKMSAVRNFIDGDE